MAQRRPPSSGEVRKRIRRTDEELIRDLRFRIEEIQRRAEARKAKQNPSVRLTLRALRAIEKAMSAVEADGDTSLRQILSDAREPLAEALQSRGVRVRKSRRPKRPRAKPEEA